MRLLFCLFAEDIGLLPHGLFTRLISAHPQPRRRLRRASCASSSAPWPAGGCFGVDDIPHFNGGLFDDATVLELDSDGLDILARVSALDWSSIEPAIFGTLFERSLDPAKRAQLGAHYTSRDDILLIVEPVLMAPLRRRWADVQAQARDAGRAARRSRRQPPSARASAERPDQRPAARLRRARSPHVRVLDPACGSGNFLYVALKQLLDLEKEVITFAGDIGLARFFPQVSPEQLHGIEINAYAHELAQVVGLDRLHPVAARQRLRRARQPILKPLDTIEQMDAILAYDARRQPVEPAWPEADVIIGNPPFLGGKKMRQSWEIAM